MNQPIKIEQGVPVPSNASQYGLDRFGVGDSAFNPGAMPPQIRQIVSHYGKRHQQKFTTRTVVENGVTGVRVWRIA